MDFFILYREVSINFIGWYKFIVHQPIFQQYGFKVRWHCDECRAEMACGTPEQVNVHALLDNQG